MFEPFIEAAKEYGTPEHLAGPVVGMVFVVLVRIVFGFLRYALGFDGPPRQPSELCRKIMAKIDETKPEHLGDYYIHVKTGPWHLFCSKYLCQYGPADCVQDVAPHLSRYDWSCLQRKFRETHERLIVTKVKQQRAKIEEAL